MCYRTAFVWGATVFFLAVKLQTAEIEAVPNDAFELAISKVESRLNIAAKLLQTAGRELKNDLKELCRNVEDPECECKDRIRYFKPADCSDIYMEGERSDGLYDIWLQDSTLEGPLKVFCDMESNGGGWTVIQRRGDYGSPEDYFFRDWNAYKVGFGEKLKDFWIGNDNLFRITDRRLYELRVNLTTWEEETAYATYDEFRISDERNWYTLHVKGYNGTAGDSLTPHNGEIFKTKDADNTNRRMNCAIRYKGAWWYYYPGCLYSNLNGLYRKGEGSFASLGKVVMWRTFKGFRYSLRDVVMKIRPADFTSNGK